VAPRQIERAIGPLSAAGLATVHSSHARSRGIVGPRFCRAIIERCTMQDTPQHRWDVTPEEAVEIQQQLRNRVRLTNGFDPSQGHPIEGLDAWYRDVARAAVVVLAYPEMRVVASAIAARETPFPYVPGLLSFREAPAVLDAFEKLSVRPDLIMC